MENIIIDEKMLSKVLIDRKLAGGYTFIINVMVSVIVAFLYIVLYSDFDTHVVLGHHVPPGYEGLKLIHPYLFLFPAVFFIWGVLIFLCYRHVSVGVYFMYVTLYLFSTLILFLYVILFIYIAHVAPFVQCISHLK